MVCYKKVVMIVFGLILIVCGIFQIQIFGNYSCYMYVNCVSCLLIGFRYRDRVEGLKYRLSR